MIGIYYRHYRRARGYGVVRSFVLAVWAVVTG